MAADQWCLRVLVLVVAVAFGRASPGVEPRVAAPPASLTNGLFVGPATSTIVDSLGTTRLDAPLVLLPQDKTTDFNVTVRSPSKTLYSYPRSFMTPMTCCCPFPGIVWGRFVAGDNN